MNPADALDRIVYLLDRQRAPGHRVKAYKRAAEVVRELSAEELAELVTHGRLQELAGIGPSTSAVITQAFAGQTPDKLLELEAESSVAPTAVEGAELRAALRGDCHAHSTWSDGGASIEAMARAAQALGHEYLVMTDHSPRLTVAHGLNAERLREQLDEVARLNEEMAPFRILTGIEVDILLDGALDQSEELLGQLDVVVASVHSKLSMPHKEMTERLLLAVSSPYVDILGHCTGRLVPGPGGKGRRASEFDAELVFAACQMFDTAVEINCRPERQDPPDDLFDIAMGLGCRFAIDTDAHAPGQLEWQVYGCDKAARHDLAHDRVVNTMVADDLLAWTATHHP
ncbi:MAG: putative hydrolase [Acidimicrobiia bacterium]|nr:putative hydrolase [Acidimicrobiia bacterium]